MADRGTTLLQMINPDYKPLRESTRMNTPSIASRPFFGDQVDSKFIIAPVSSTQQSLNLKLEPLTHRAGDWICLCCNNHNYSFREICNRCGIQSKSGNLKQSLSLYQNQNISPDLNHSVYRFEQTFVCDTYLQREVNGEPLKTMEIDYSASKTSIFDSKVKERSNQILQVDEEVEDNERKEFAFEKQLCFTSSDEEANYEVDEDDYPNSASKEHEKRILKFLNFD